MATRAPPVGVDHPTVVPTNLHGSDEDDQDDEAVSEDVDPSDDERRAS